MADPSQKVHYAIVSTDDPLYILIDGRSVLVTPSMRINGVGMTPEEAAFYIPAGVLAPWTGEPTVPVVRPQTGTLTMQRTPPREPNVLIPYYLNLASPYSDPDVATLIDVMKRHRRVPTTVILNPDNGPGATMNADYTEFIKVIGGALGRAIGYVSTAYGVRPYQEVVDDIQRWRTLYPGISGIFLDEQPWNDAALVQYYVSLTTYCHNLELYPVIANPGTNQSPSYFSAATADVIVVHEAADWPLSDSMEGKYLGGHYTVDLRRRAALVHSQATLDVQTLKDLMRYVGSIYVTDQSGVNPWAALSVHLPALYDALTAM